MKRKESQILSGENITLIVDRKDDYTISPKDTFELYTRRGSFSLDEVKRLQSDLNKLMEGYNRYFR
jgi:flagellar basal body rod protein FlgG